MLNLKTSRDSSEEEAALRKVVAFLVEKIGSGRVRGNSGQDAAFSSELERLRERAGQEESSSLLSITAGAAAQAMEIHNLKATELMRQHSAEIQCIVSMIAETVSKVGGENSAAARQLTEVWNKFDRVGSLEEIPPLLTHLAACLRSFEDEMGGNKSVSQAATSDSGDIDPVTGLHRRPAALLAMESAAEAGGHLFVVAMVVRGVQSNNSRFGFGAGDRMLRVFKENIQKQLPATDRLYRWDGPAIVALAQRTEPLGEVRAQFRRLLDTRLEETYDLNGRPVLLPITASGLTFSFVPPVETAVKMIQTFINGQGSAPAAN